MLRLVLGEKGRRVRMSHTKISFYESTFVIFFVLKAHLHVENGLRTCFKTDFTASHSLQVILSVAALLFEITFSKFPRKKIMVNRDAESVFKEKFVFTYESKCIDFKNAMNYFMLLRVNLLNDGELKVLFLKITKILRDKNSKIFVLFVFELNNPGILDKIVKQFDAFISYLNSSSQK
jgi:hypothetical protein